MSLLKSLRAPLAAALVVIATLATTAPAPALAQASAPAAEAPAPAPAAAPAATVAKEEVANPYGLEALWTQGDFVARGTLVIMIIMSMGSWYIIFTKLFEQRKLLKSADAAAKKANYARVLKRTMAIAFPSVAMAADITRAAHAPPRTYRIAPMPRAPRVKPASTGGSPSSVGQPPTAAGSRRWRPSRATPATRRRPSCGSASSSASRSATRRCSARSRVQSGRSSSQRPTRTQRSPATPSSMSPASTPARSERSSSACSGSRAGTAIDRSAPSSGLRGTSRRCGCTPPPSSVRSTPR